MTGSALPSLALARGTIDRAARHRTDAAWLTDRWSDPNSRLLVVCEGETIVTGDPPELELIPTTSVPPTAVSQRWFLGLDHATALFATSGGLPDGGRRANLREIGALLSDRDAGLLTTAVALESWHALHVRCSRCGAATGVIDGGMVRACPVDGSLQHPRVDPAVIMAVIDSDDRLLLAHQARWPARRFSTLAGFVEPGESLEQAVAREVHEETGVSVRSATYLGSQPWPFPRSLMLGFIAHAATTEICEDGIEVTHARWFSRAELAAAVSAEEIVLPPRLSISRRLIERWFGDRLEVRSALRDG